MSKVIKGVIDLPHVDLTDLENVYETILFLIEQQMFPSWQIKKEKNFIHLIHPSLSYTWIKIFNNGRIEYDNHHGITEEIKNQLLELINEYFPMIKKLNQLQKQLDLSPQNCKMNFNKETQEITITIEDNN